MIIMLWDHAETLLEAVKRSANEPAVLSEGLLPVDLEISTDGAVAQILPSVEECFVADASAHHGYVTGKISSCWHVTALYLNFGSWYKLLLHSCMNWPRSCPCPV